MNGKKKTDSTDEEKHEPMKEGPFAEDTSDDEEILDLTDSLNGTDNGNGDIIDLADEIEPEEEPIDLLDSDDDGIVELDEPAREEDVIPPGDEDILSLEAAVDDIDDDDDILDLGDEDTGAVDQSSQPDMEEDLFDLEATEIEEDLLDLGDDGDTGELSMEDDDILALEDAVKETDEADEGDLFDFGPEEEPPTEDILDLDDAVEETEETDETDLFDFGPEEEPPTADILDLDDEEFETEADKGLEPETATLDLAEFEINDDDAQTAEEDEAEAIPFETADIDEQDVFDLDEVESATDSFGTELADELAATVDIADLSDSDIEPSTATIDADTAEDLPVIELDDLMAGDAGEPAPEEIDMDSLMVGQGPGEDSGELMDLDDLMAESAGQAAEPGMDDALIDLDDLSSEEAPGDGSQDDDDLLDLDMLAEDTGDGLASAGAEDAEELVDLSQLMDADEMDAGAESALAATPSSEADDYVDLTELGVGDEEDSYAASAVDTDSHELFAGEDDDDPETEEQAALALEDDSSYEDLFGGDDDEDVDIGLVESVEGLDEEAPLTALEEIDAEEEGDDILDLAEMAEPEDESSEPAQEVNPYFDEDDIATEAEAAPAIKIGDEIEDEWSTGSYEQDEFVDNLGMEIPASAAASSMEPQEAGTVTQTQVETAIQAVVEKMLGEKIDQILTDVIEKAVTQEIKRIKTLLLEEDRMD